MLQAMPKEDYLAKLEARIRYNREVVETMFLSLGREERSWQPQRSEWSVDQCLQHLVLSFEALSPKMDAALNTPESADFDGLFHHTWFARKTMGKQFDPNIKLRSVKKFDPPAAYQEDILTRFLAQLDRMLEIVEQARGADLQAKCWITKGLPIRYNLGDFLNLFVSHDELHLGQALKVVAAYYDWLEKGMVLTAVPNI